MAAKRSASAQLTSDNWEKEDENDAPKQTGFTKASSQELERRPMKTARRTLTAVSSTGTQRLAAAVDLTGGLGLKTTPLVMPLGTSQSSYPGSLSMSAPLVSPRSSTADSNSKYMKKLCSLNESVSRCISDHVKKNPYIDLTPVFEDYKKYLKELDQADKEGGGEQESVVMETASTGDKEVCQETVENGKETDEEDSQQSPSTSQEEGTAKLKLEVTDTDCLLALRCKLYYKKESQFVELGIGKLRVEETDNGVRLLLRNDTSLGQILLNVRVNSQIPMTLQKNHLLIVCTPNPPLESKSPAKADDSEATPSTPPLPITYVIKVKDATIAEKLHSTIKARL